MTRYYRAKYKPVADAGGNETNAVYSSYSTDPANVFDFTPAAGTYIAGGEWWEDTPLVVSAIPSDVIHVQTVARNGTASLTNNHTFDLPTGMVTGNRVAVSVIRTRNGTIPGLSTVPSWWQTPSGNNALDGDATHQSRLEHYYFDVADWIANSSPTQVALGGTQPCYRCVTFTEFTPINGVVETPVFTTSSNDPPSITFSATASRLVITTFVRTNYTSQVTAAPTNYTNLQGCNVGNTGVTAVDRSLYVASRVLTAASENPGAPTTSGGSARLVSSIAFG